MKSYKGYWVTPEADEEGLVGTLTIARNEGPVLEITNTRAKKTASSLGARLQSPLGSQKPSDRSFVVLGKSLNGTCFTLYDGFVRNRQDGLVTDLGIYTLYFNHGFEGACVESPSELVVDQIFARFKGLDLWLDSGHFKTSYKDRYNSVTITHKKKGERRYKIDENKSLVFSTKREGPKQSMAQKKIGMSVHTWCGFRYSVPVSLSDAFDDICSIGDLLSVLLGKPTSFGQTFVKSPQHTIALGENEHKVDIWLLGDRTSLPESFRKWTPRNVLMPFHLLRSRFSRIVKKWMRFRVENWGFVVPYFACLRLPSPLADRRFFDLASSAESLHSHLRPREKKFNDREARKITKRLCSLVPEKKRASFEIALQRVNDLYFKDRLERLLARFPKLATDVIGTVDQQRKFCKLVKDLRNREAHRLKRTKGTSVSGLTLVRLTAKLRVVIDAWVLAENGVPEHVVEQTMRSNREYWFYASNTTWPWDASDD